MFTKALCIIHHLHFEFFCHKIQFLSSFMLSISVILFYLLSVNILYMHVKVRCTYTPPNFLGWEKGTPFGTKCVVKEHGARKSNKQNSSLCFLYIGVLKQNCDNKRAYVKGLVWCIASLDHTPYSKRGPWRTGRGNHHFWLMA